MDENLKTEDIEYKTKKDREIKRIFKDNIGEDPYILFMVEFVDYLRSHKFQIPVNKVIDLFNMMKDFNVINRKETIRISKTLFCQNKMQYDAYDDLFNSYCVGKYKNNEFMDIVKKKLEEDVEDEIKSLQTQIDNQREQMEKENDELRSKAVKKAIQELQSEFKAQRKKYKNVSTNSKENVQSSIAKLTQQLIKEYSENSQPNNEEDNHKKIDISEEKSMGEDNELNKNEQNNSENGQSENEDNNMSAEGKANDETKLLNDFLRGISDDIYELIKENYSDKIKKLTENLLELLKEMLSNGSNPDAEMVEAFQSAAKMINKLNNEIEKQTFDMQIEQEMFKNKSEFEKTESKLNHQMKIIQKSTSINHRETFTVGKNAVQTLENINDKTIKELNFDEIKSVIEYIKANAPKFKTKIGLSMKTNKNKKFDYKKTVIESRKYGNIPMKFYYKKPKIKKYRLIAVLDNSGSVSAYLPLLLNFVYEISTVFNKGVEGFVFVDSLIPITDELKNETIGDIIRNHSGVRGYSNYGNVIYQLNNDYSHLIDNRTIIIFLGDARNNKRRNQNKVLEEIHNKAKQVIWLNPEKQDRWYYGDSEMGLYEQNVDEVYCVNTVDNLISFLENYSIKQN